LSVDVILLNPSYIYPPFAPEDIAELRNDPLVMDLPNTEFLYPPVGLLSIGGALKRAGYTVQGVDSNTWPMTMEELARHCESAKVVGISLLVANLRSTWQLVQLMKGRGYEIVLGGAYPSVEPEIVAKMGLRYGISGEGEISFTQLCDALIRNEGKPEDIDGIIIAEPGEDTVFTREPVLLDSLNDWLPDRTLMRRGTYKLPFAGTIEMALASRGCPYKCTFCYCSSDSPNAMFNTSRWVDVDVIVRDVIDTTRRYKPQYLEMIDETFTVSRKFAMEFSQALIDAKFDVPWGAKTRIDLMDDELMAKMAEAGLRKIGFGLESGVYDHRLAMQKGFTNARVKSVFDAAARNGVESACTIIFGHPNETAADMQASVDFVKEIRAAYVEFHIMVLIPKTKLFDHAVKEGKVTADVFDRFMRGEVPYPEYSPGNLTPADMRRIHRDAIKQFYFRPRYIKQALGRVRKPEDLMQYARAAKSLFKMSDLNRPIWAVGRRRKNG
jgi:anaerobic magnesium-protoporphyrin IX monomethyl ester cyclase